MIIERDIKTNVNVTPDEKLYVPAVLASRIKNRLIQKYFFYANVVFITIYFIFAALYLNAGKYTKEYVSDIGDFWLKVTYSNFKSDEVAYSCNLLGIFTLMMNLFCSMNLIVMGLHIYLGGLRARTRICVIINFTCHLITFLISLAYIARYKAMIVLNPIYFTVSFLNILLATLQSYFLRRMIRKESKYMLPVNLLMFHKQEYCKEFLEKLKIGSNF